MEAVAPAAPPPATAAPAAPPAAPSSSPPITVTPAAIDKGPQAPPPKPGSAKDRMFQDLRKVAGNEPETKPAVTKESTTPAEVQPETTTETEGTSTATPDTATATADKKKVSPWKLVDEHKAARLKAETEIAELRKSMVAPEKVKEYETKLSEMQKRAQELEEHIKFVDYSKSQEFADKYQKPYQEAWTKWMGELGELTVPDPASGGERAIAPQDLLELVNMPLQKAREQADSTFGAFANDVMAARKEIRGLFEAQSKALEDARKTGSDRVTTQMKQMQERQQALNQEISQTWTQSNEAAAADEAFGKYFKPADGDEDGNARLKKGYEMADKAFSVNPMDPNLTPEQRKQIVQLHAAVRNRSAAFGRLVAQNTKLSTELSNLKAELAKFAEVQPGAAGGRQEPASGGHVSAKASMLDALHKIAR